MVCDNSSDPLVLTDTLLVGVVTSGGGEWLNEWAGGWLVGEHLFEEERWSVPNGLPEGKREGGRGRERGEGQIILLRMIVC